MAEYAQMLFDLIDEHLVSFGFDPILDPDQGTISFSVMLEGRLNTSFCLIEVSETGFAFYIDCPLRANPADREQMKRMAEFLHRVNYTLFSGNFELEMDQGVIRYRNYVDCVEMLPSDSIIRFAVLGGLSIYQHFSQGVMEVLFTDIAPADLVASLTQSQDPKSSLYRVHEEDSQPQSEDEDEYIEVTKDARFLA